MDKLLSKAGFPVFIIDPKEVLAVWGTSEGSGILFRNGREFSLQGEPIQVLDHLFPPLEVAESEEDAKEEYFVRSEEDEYLIEMVKAAHFEKFGVPLDESKLQKGWLEALKDGRSPF